MGFLGVERPFLDLVSQTPRPRGRGRPLFAEQCQVVVFIADDLGFLGPGSPDLMTELCPQIASDFKSRSPNRKNIPQIAVKKRFKSQFKSSDL